MGRPYGVPIPGRDQGVKGGSQSRVIRMASDNLDDGSEDCARIAAGLSPLLLRRLLRAKDAMDARSEEDWPIRRLAGVAGVSDAHFARSFRQAFGIPPHRYLLTRRIERASTLLRESDIGVTTIAFDTGWNSLGTFGRVFRDVTGDSPTAIRGGRREVAAHPLAMPPCYRRDAGRPDLRIAVSEKRRGGRSS